MVVIEMNPRVSRSSALASKATGFPIAKIAARLAVGYTLDEIPNDITKKTPSCFEPTIDYVVVKIPKWAQEKFPDSDHTLGPQMKSVGEVMAIGRTFKEALMKGIRSLETGRKTPTSPSDPADLERRLAIPHPERLWDLLHAFEIGYSAELLHEITRIDPWFLNQLQQILELKQRVKALYAGKRSRQRIVSRQAVWILRCPTGRIVGKERGRGAAAAPGAQHAARIQTRGHVRGGIRIVYAVSLFDLRRRKRGRAHRPARKIMILGSGPNRIGQGIEFDYCCVHASYALKEEGFETIMVNCNPETVSTDYDTSDRLYFEPLTFEDVMAIVEEEKPDGRDCAIRRADASEPGPPTEGCGRAHCRHHAGIDRSGGRPQTLRQAAGRIGNPAAGKRRGDECAGSAGDCHAHRLSRAGAAFLRAGRPGHGDRLR